MTIESLIAQWPVPGIKVAGETPPFTKASNSFLFSATDIELASLLVPKIASPAQPVFSSHRQWRTKRSASGE